MKLPLCILLLLTTATAAQAQSPDAQGLEFFEKKIRPVLVDNCYKCHSVDAKKLRGALLLDSRWGWQQGGESGAVIVPGKPSESVLISALRYEKFEMPPKAKLPSEVVADFEKWIEMGAPDPRAKKVRTGKVEDAFDLDERSLWWSLQPIRDVAIPEVKKQDWPRVEYDRFVLAALEKKGWQPAEPASRNSWLRRVTYDLTGLPPTPADVRDFLEDQRVEDDSTEAYEKVVDRLLDSPHFGEQWARHWMDLVRYAETKAFEADYPMPNAFQYRDYLIRAFNDDVPYDRFVKEQIAGDLLEPRTNAQTGINESVIGPGYLYLTDGQHGPPDVHADEARIFDDMIDVVGKTFLSHGIACARCHDHKFDAITTKDYYSLYGVIASSRIDYADINPPARQKEHRGRLRKQKVAIRRALADVLAGDVKTVREDLRAVQEGKPTTPQQTRWSDALKKKPNEVLKGLAALLSARDESTIESVWITERDRVTDRSTQAEGVAGSKLESLGNLARTEFGAWIASGVSFEDAPRPPGDFIVAAGGDNTISSFVGGRPAAGHLGSRFAGSMKSPTFTIEGESVRVRVKGRNVRVSLYVRHYELVGRGPTTGGTTKVINSDTWQTVSFGTRLWVGERAYIEVQHNGGEVNHKWSTGKHVDGAYAVLETAVNNRGLPAPRSSGTWVTKGDAPDIPLGRGGGTPLGREGWTPDFVLDHVASRIGALAEAWRAGKLTMAQGDLLEGLFTAGVLDFGLGRSESLRQSVESFRKLQREHPAPIYVRSLSDGQGVDEPVYIRGSHKNGSKEPNPRHFLDGIDGTPFRSKGSGRLEWAEALVASDNPLTARVMVNRVWHHLFGRGIVSSVDDFGHMGEKPTHPELLDFLARRFVKDGWSVKRLIRQLVLSSTYRMSSEASNESLREDPNNELLQHMIIRRLTAEQIRDTLLAISGELDRQQFGPSQGGDGGNRRSVYIQLRRRFMPKFLMTFDLPNSTEPFGRRNITSGPTQSLEMLNGAFVWRAAERWASRVHGVKESSFEQRIDLMHRQAFGRGVTERELEWALQILDDYGIDAASVEGNHWKELCHTMLNRKELIFVY